mgnify:FL=1
MIDQLAKQIFNDINQKASQFSENQDQASSQVRAIIESALRKLNLVTRDEFDAQQAVLLRTREKLEQLESRLAEFEKEHSRDS